MPQSWIIDAEAWANYILAIQRWANVVAGLFINLHNFYWSASNSIYLIE